MKRLKKWTCAFLAMLLMACTVPVYDASAASFSELQQKRKNLAASTEKAKKEISNIKNKQASLEQEMDALDKVLNSLQAEVDEAQEQLDFITKKLQEAEMQLEEATKKRDEQFELLGSRMRFLQQKGSTGYFEILLESESFSDLFLRMQYVNDIMAFDKDILTKLEEIQTTIQTKRDEIEESRAEQEVVLAEHKAKLAEQQKIVDEKKAVFATYEKDLKKYEQMVKANEKLEKDVLNQMTQLSNNNNSSRQTYVTGNGQFAWPVPGYSRISSEYGYRTSPISGKREFHNGLDIPGGYGTAIVAAQAGKITYSGWMNGYGYTIIVDHGGGLTTLYGHNSSLVAKKGQMVSKGQVIAKCGSTGWSTGNHCHFTVSKNGSYVNPHNYL